MAYFQQELMSATAGGSGNSLITIVNGAIADSFINKAVTYDDQPGDLSNPKVKLAGNNDVVIGSIVGTSYGKLQIAVSGWDVKFLAIDGNDIVPGTRILGAADTNDLGYVKGFTAPTTINQAALANTLKARGAVLNGTTSAKGDVIRVSMRLGA